MIEYEDDRLAFAMSCFEAVLRGSRAGSRGLPDPARGLVRDRLDGGLARDGHHGPRVDRFDNGLARVGAHHHFFPVLVLALDLGQQ